MLARRYPSHEPDRHTFWCQNLRLDCVHEAYNVRQTEMKYFACIIERVM